MRQEASAAVLGPEWTCVRCQQVAPETDHFKTLQHCRNCSEMYIYAGSFCPACGTPSARAASPSPPPQAPPVPPVESTTPDLPASSPHSPWLTYVAGQGLQASPLAPIWPLKAWWEKDGTGLEAPPCPACGGKLRPDGAGEHHYPGYAAPPWNAAWDGRCASCGHVMEAVVTQKTHFKTWRTVTMAPAESFHQTFIDEGLVFSGVRIRVEENVYHDATPQVSEVFVSMGELMALVKALNGALGAVQAQMDWSCDWT